MFHKLKHLFCLHEYVADESPMALVVICAKCGRIMPILEALAWLEWKKFQAKAKADRG